MAVLPSQTVLMRSFWFDPYLWVHLAGIAAVPLFLELCLLGLAIGTPLFPAWFELLFVGAIGILPVLWMQWQRPFSIFSLLLLALRPAQLTDDQRRILQRFKTPLHRILAVLTAVAMAWVLWQLYQIAPTVTPTLFPGVSRGMALLIAAIAFLGSNLFLQVPVSVLSVLLVDQRTFASTSPYPVEQVAQSFTVPGIRVAKILPPLLRPVTPTPAAAPPEAPAAKAAKPGKKSTSAAAPTPPAAPTQVTPTPTPIAAPIPETESLDEYSNPFPELDLEPDAELDVQPDEVETAIEEEVEIIEELAREELAETESATIEPETQTRETAGMPNLENEGIEAIAQPTVHPPELTQLEESGEVTEEIVIASAPPPLAEMVAELNEARAIESELNAALGDSMPDASSTNETDSTVFPGFPDSVDATNDSGDDSGNDLADSLSEASAKDAADDLTKRSPTPPVEIIEDATIAETFSTRDAEDRSETDNNPDNPETST